jgi:predicted Zn-dependent peptidase
VRSGFVEAEGQRPFTIRAPVQTDRTADAIREIRRELEAFLGERPPTEEEVRRVKLDAVRSLPGRYETSRAVLASLQESARFDRPWNYPETLRAAYEALSAEDAAAAARRVLAPERMVWVIVGDAAKIEAELRALELGAFEVRTLEAP